MKPCYRFDIQDNDISPQIYSLLFSNVIVELQGNDLYYELPVFHLLNVEEYRESNWWLTEEAEELWNKRINRGWKNTYYDSAAMEKFIKTPCTLEVAIKYLVTFLKERGITETDTVLVKLWW